MLLCFDHNFIVESSTNRIDSAQMVSTQLTNHDEYTIGNDTAEGMYMWINYVFALFFSDRNKHTATKIRQVILGEAEIGAGSGDGTVYLFLFI